MSLCPAKEQSSAQSQLNSTCVNWLWSTLLYFAEVIVSPLALSSALCTVSPTSAAGELHLQNYYVPLVGLKLKPLVPARSIF